MNASDTDIGTVLSQCSGPDEKLHACALFSHRLSPAERNYDVGNRELLPIKLALEKWRHWLEGAQQPFVVWTDHKNLACIHTAEQLNSRRARWALFFGTFNFTLIYHPGSRNVKLDALSRQYVSEESPSIPDIILPFTCVVAAVSWEIASAVREAQRSQPDPGNGSTQLPLCA